jgi:hypothetical protein
MIYMTATASKNIVVQTGEGWSDAVADLEFWLEGAIIGL